MLQIKVSVLLIILLVAMNVFVNTDASEPFVVVPINNSTMSDARGVRNIGMGATGTADMSWLSTGFFNPASIAWTDALTVGSSRQDLHQILTLSDTQISGGGVLGRSPSLGAWRFGGSLGLSTMSSEPQELRTVYIPDGTGQMFTHDAYYVSGSGAISWRKSNIVIGVGAKTKYLNETFRGKDASAWAFDVGAIAALPHSWNDYMVRPRAGIAFTNLSGGFSPYDRASSIEGERRWALGIDLASPLHTVGNGSWRRSVAPISLSFDYDNVHRRLFESNDRRWAMGWEVSFIDMVQARYGLNSRTFSSDERARTYGFGVGWDFGRLLFQIDYAHMSADRFAGVLDENVFGIIVGGRM